MDLWEPYSSTYIENDFGSKRELFNTGQRWNASLAQVSDRSVNLDPSAALFHTYSEAKRYVICKDIGFDLLITMYDVNTKNFFGMRPVKELISSDWVRINTFFSKLRKSNIEIRGIGMQNSHISLNTVINRAHENIKGHFIEIDTFGNEARHVCIDLKTGMSYNLLMLNRIYRPGELVGQANFDDFKTRKSQLSFVYV
jgi:hypothetical protein